MASAIDRLHKQLSSNLGVVPFVGAGLSVPCGLPHWSELLRKLASELKYTTNIDALIFRGKFEEAAGLIQEVLGPDLFTARLQQELGPHLTEHLTGPVLLLPALTRGPVITTNLDGIIERVFHDAGFPFQSVGFGAQVDAVWGALHLDQPFLLKLHGDLDDSNTCVLTLDDYETTYGSRDPKHISTSLALPKILEQIFTSRSLLFVGCSLTVDRTLIYMRRVKQMHAAPAQHFALLEDPGDKRSMAAREVTLAEMNILPIWFPEGRFDFIEELLAEAMEPRFLRPQRMVEQPSYRGDPEGLLGIDLGTSNTAIAFAPSESSVEYLQLTTDNYRTLVQSTVRFLPKLKYCIGDEQAPGMPMLAEVRHFKRFLGTQHLYRVGRRDYTPKDVATLFLKGLHTELSIRFSENVPPVIIAAPANFVTHQTNELVKCFLDAGFDVRRVVGEPVAAVLNVNLRDFSEDSQRNLVLVVDIGGGTTDVSVVEVAEIDEETQFETLSLTGDNALGGVDFDAILIEIVRKKLVQRYGERGIAIYRFKSMEIQRQASTAKARLNEVCKVEMILSDVETTVGHVSNIVVEINKEQFEVESAQLLQRVGRLIDTALEDAVGMDAQKLAQRGWKAGSPDYYEVLTTVMLAGQASKISSVREFIQKKIPLNVIDWYQDVAVARGLARQASVMGGKIKNMLLLDAMYHSIYVGLLSSVDGARWQHLIGDKTAEMTAKGGPNGQKLYKLMERNTLIPTKRGSFRLDMQSPRTEVTLEVFDSVKHGRRSFHPIGEIPLQFSNSTQCLDMEIDVDANRTVVFKIRAVDLDGRSSIIKTPRTQRHAAVQLNNLHLNSRFGVTPIGGVKVL